MSKRVNLEIAGIFYEMADILEIKKVWWKPQAYRIAAQTLESLKTSVSEIYKKRGAKGIDALPGIGEGITEKIIQYIKKAKISEHEKLKNSLPKGLYELLNVPGVGPKKALLFHNKLKIHSVAELKQAAKEKKIESIKGFKQKSEKNILENIKIMKPEKRISLANAKKIAEKILSLLRKIPEVQQAVVAGSIRRKKQTVGDIDIVVLTNSPKNVVEKFTTSSFVKKVLAKGNEKVIALTNFNIQVDIRLFNKKSFGAGLLYFTGSKQHNIKLRKLAIKKGMKLNEYGLFFNGKVIAGETENQIYKKLGLSFTQPEDRV